MPSKKSATPKKAGKSPKEKTPVKPKVVEPVDSDSEDDSGSEEEVNIFMPQKTTAKGKKGAKNGKAAVPPPEESESDDGSDEEEKAPVKQAKSAKKAGKEDKGKKQAAPPKESSSEESSEEEMEIGTPAPPPAKAAKDKRAGKKQAAAAEEESSDEESSEEETKAPQKAAGKAKKATPKQPAKAAKAEDSDSDEESEEESMEIPTPAAEVKDKAGKKRKSDKHAETKAKKVKKESDEESSEESSSEEEAPAQSKAAEESSSEGSDDESEEEKPQKPTKKDKTAKQTPAKQTTDTDSESTTLFVKNLPQDYGEDELRNMLQKEFKAATEIRIPVKNDEIKGFAFIEFSTTEDVSSALEEKQGVEVGGKSLFLDHSGQKSTKPQRNEGKEDTTLFVKNLPDGFSEQDLRDYMLKHFTGSTEVRLPTRPGGDLKGFGFVEFDNAEDMNNALNDLQGSDLYGSALFLDKVGKKPDDNRQSRGGRGQGRGGFGGRGGGGFGGFSSNRDRPRVEPGTSKTLFVKNLSYDTDKDSLREAFEGAIDTRIAMDRDSGRSKGFGYVEYSSPADAQKAYNEMKDYNLDGRQIFLDFAHERGDAPRGGGRGGGFGGRGGGFGGRGGGFRGGRGGFRGGRGGRGGGNRSFEEFKGKKKTFGDDSD